VKALTVILGPASEWLPEFYTRYAEGWYDNAPTPRQAVENAHGRFRIQSANDTLTTFTHDYRDLSAAIYHVELDYPGIDPGSVVTFRTAGRTAAINVCAYEPSPPDTGEMYLISSFVDEAVI